MKKKIQSLAIIVAGMLLVTTFLSSCKKVDSNDEQVKTANGKYGGVMVGSSGYFIINLPVGQLGTATIYFDGKIYELATAIPLSENAVSYNNLLFSTTNNQITMRFSVEENGVNPTVEFTIPGHQITATVDQYGEETNSVSLYQGSSYSSSGKSYIIHTFNMALNYNDNSFKAISRVRLTNTATPVGETEIIKGTFTRSGNNITLNYDGRTLAGNILGTTIQFEETDFTMTGSEVAVGGIITSPASIVGKWIPYVFFNGSEEGSTIEMVNVNECPQGKYVEMYANGTYKDVWWAVVDGYCQDVNNSNALYNYTINGNQITLDGADFEILELSNDKFIFEGFNEEDGKHYYFKGEYHREN